MKRIGPVVVLALALLLPASTAADAGIDGATNAYRASQGLPAIATSATLESLAQQRVQQIVTAFEHDFWWWGPSDCDGVGENLAWSEATDSEWPLRAWIASPDHQHNLVGDWDFMGSAEIVVDGTRYAVQLFGSNCASSVNRPAPKPSSPPTPTEHIPAPTTPSVQSEPVVPLIPDTAMRSPCLTSRTLCPSLNRMTMATTCSVFSVQTADTTSSPESAPTKLPRFCKAG